MEVPVDLVSAGHAWRRAHVHSYLPSAARRFQDPLRSDLLPAVLHLRRDRSVWTLE